MAQGEPVDFSWIRQSLTYDKASEDRVDKAIKSDINIKMLTELAPTIIWTRNAKWDLTYINSYWFEFTGCEDRPVREINWQEFIHPDDLKGVTDYWNTALELQLEFKVDLRLRRRDGEYRWFQSVGRPVTNQAGEVIQWLGVSSIIQDLKDAQEETERLRQKLEEKVLERTRALEEAQAQVLAEISARQATQDALRQAQKMESVGQLTGGIAHDFNNMLTVIIGNLELLKMSAPKLGDNPVAKRMERNVRMAIEASMKAEKLTAQLLAFSRKARLQLERLDANVVVIGVKEMVERAVGLSVSCDIKIQEDLWLCLSDKTQLESAIINLAINARDAMPEGGKLCISTANKVMEDLRFVSVSVSDTGLGMNQETLEKACEPFFTTKDVGKGSGLGLSMVYGFCEQSNGKLLIESEEGKGTIVEMLFPFTAGETIEETQAEEDFNFDAAKQSILVVDDEPAVRELACQLLTDAGFNVISAQDGQSAIKIIQDSTIPLDLLFTDIVMPGGIDGFGLAKITKQERPTLPIIFTTGHAEVALKELKKDLTQKIKVIGKPYRLNELKQMILHELAIQ